MLKLVSMSIEILKKEVSKHPPTTALILGSGWNRVVDKVKVIKSWDYTKIFKVKSTVPGHKGQLIYGILAKKPVLIMAGRFHIYEGHSAQTSVKPIQLIKELGIKNLITTCACGGLNPKYQVGDFVILTDLITLLAPTPLIGPKFQDLSQIYNPKLQQICQKQITKLKIHYQKGVYVYCHGPQYESPADKKALRILGADVVGMSTVPETIMTKHLGLKVLGLGFVTNLAFEIHGHADVLKQSRQASPKMVDLLTEIVRQI